MSIDIAPIWDFRKPELSEQRFREALPTASPEDAFILKTQIARTFGLRKEFAKAQSELAEIETQLKSASLEGRVRYYLELGRTYSSPVHPLESQSPEVKAQARAAYLRAVEIATEANLDNLAIDALHMMTVVDTSPEDQLKWNRKALALLESSTQPNAKKWEGSLRNNVGYALHLAGRYEEALSEFKLALALREITGKIEPIRIGHWMIAWTLRALGRFEEAVEIQLRLEKERAASDEADPYVFEELECLYRALKNEERADYYAKRLAKQRVDA